MLMGINHDDEHSFFEGELQILRIQFYDESGTMFEYGINAQKIESIVESTVLKKIPNAHEPVVGILKYRSVPIPVVDMSMLCLDAATKQVGKHPPRIIICKVSHKLIGFLVPKVLPILQIANNDVLEPSAEFSLNAQLPLQGIYNYSDGFLLIADIETVIENISGMRDESVQIDENPNIKDSKILLVEDSKYFQMKMKEIFSKLKVHYQVASNGKEAWEILQGKNKFDLIITDVEMPIMNGIQLAKKIKSENHLARIPILFCSSISNKTLIKEIEEENLGTYIVKFNPEEMVEAVSTLLVKRSGFCLFD